MPGNSDTPTFETLGRMEALRRLYAETPYTPVNPVRYRCSDTQYIATASQLFTEGIDFDLVYFPLKHLGYKVVTCVTAELYASLAQPKTLTVNLGISSKLDYSSVREIWTGAVSAAQEHGYEQVALDLAPSRNGLIVSISATAHTPLSIEKGRPSPCSKDLICVSGSLGAAYLGQRLLEREKATFDTRPGAERDKDLERNRMIVAAYLRPELSPATPQRLCDEDLIPSCGYSVSKGLADALKRLSRDTGLGAKVYADKIPFEGNTFALGSELDIDPVSAAMNGGEDYRLLYVIPILSLEKFRRDFQTFDIIGHLARPEAGTVLVTPDGLEHEVTGPGW